MKSITGRNPYEIKDFSGGQITKSPPKNIDTKCSPDCLNVYAEGAILRKRLGITVLNPTTMGQTGNGLYNWNRSYTTQWLISFWREDMRKMDVVGGAWDGVWDIVAAGTNGTAFTTAGGITYFANFNSVLLISNEGYEHIQKMTTSDSSYSNIEVGGTGVAPLAKYIAVWKNHAWFLNCSGSVDRVVHSAVNSYNNFTGTTYGANDLITENDIGLTGWFILNGRLYATKAFSIFRFTYTGSPSPLVDIRAIKNTVGTKSPRTIKNIRTTEGEAVAFLGSDKKLYICDGQDVLELSNAIEISNGLSSIYMNAINANYLDKCHAVVHEDLCWYELFVCVGTASIPSVSIVYDYKASSFWPMDNRPFTYAIVGDNGAGQRKVYAQDSTGTAYLLNNGNSDAGNAINAYWTTPKLGTSVLLAKIDEVEVETEAVAGTPTFSWRADWESGWVSKTMAINTNSHNWNPGRIDNMIQFRIADNSTNPPFKLWTILLSERLIGGGK